MIGIQDEELNTVLAMFLASLMDEIHFGMDTFLLAMKLLDTKEKIAIFAYWVQDFVKEGNPYNVTPDMIERTVNRINLGRKLPNPKMENNS